MIKKLLIMSAGIVFSSLITTASIAWTPPSNSCIDARNVYLKFLNRVRLCRDYDECFGFNLSGLRECKILSLKQAQTICPHGWRTMDNSEFLNKCMWCMCDCDFVWYEAFISKAECWAALDEKESDWGADACYECNMCSKEGIGF